MNRVSLSVRKGFFAVSASLLLLAPVVATAGSLKTDIGAGLKNTGDNTGLGSTSITQTVGTVIKAFLGLLGVVLVVLIIYAGFLWMTAAGNEEKVTQAKTIIKNAVIGMVILMAAYAITNFVVDAVLTGTGAQ